ncbi:MAG: sugar phosphorylase [Salinispira sp.]
MNIEQFISALYENRSAGATLKNIEKLIAEHRPALEAACKKYASAYPVPQAGNLPWNETDAFLITYGDTFLPEKSAAKNTRSLPSLRKFAETYLQNVMSGIHILPFFPYSSDDGFSIVDFYKVNSELGTWEDISPIAREFRLMADLVLNHCSARGPWFKDFLNNSPEYRDFFITLPPNTDVAGIVRPRTHPLLTAFTAADGAELNVWTTFSADQIDLNFANPTVLVRMLDVTLFLIERGVQVIRLDAIAYLWKELGTSSIHHRKTHLLVQLYRHILEAVAPWVILITETNVPHEENMSYFGNGSNEAHMIYQFSLPPLILDAFLRGDADHLSNWARTIPSAPPCTTHQGPIGQTCTYFNFCASHDGIGLTPAQGILSSEELDGLCTAVTDRGGRISYKATPSGNIPYELNINYFSAIAEKELPEELRIRKFLASQAILLSVVGVPGIYVHSLIGSENWQEGVAITGANRSINRQKLFLNELIKELDDPGSLRHRVFHGWARMLTVRRGQKAFHPAAGQCVLDAGAPQIFAVLREETLFSGKGAGQKDAGQRIICLINTSGITAQAAINLPESTHSGTSEQPKFLSDLLEGKRISISANATISGNAGSTGTTTISMAPWEVLWLEVQN